MEEQGCFAGLVVIVGAAAGLGETQFAIESEGCDIGFANFEKENLHTKLVCEEQEFAQQVIAATLAALFFWNGDVQNLDFVAKVAPLQCGQHFVIECQKMNQRGSDCHIFGLRFGRLKQGKFGLAKDGLDRGTVLRTAGAENRGSALASAGSGKIISRILRCAVHVLRR